MTLPYRYLDAGTAEAKPKTMKKPKLSGKSRQGGESERHLYQIIHRMDIPTFVINKDHAVVGWNKACEMLTGVLAADVVGRQEAWKAFYSDERPVPADLVVDEVSEKVVSQNYTGK